MGLTNWLRYQALVRKRPRRYRNLFRTVHDYKCRSIIEIGTWDGTHAEQMIQTAALHSPISDVRYRGFDLFEDLTDEEFEKEFSKRPPTQNEVLRRLRATGADIRLYRGNTKTTLPRAADEIRQADLIFVDGGHSIETIQSDWSAVRASMRADAIVIFDDYYLNTEPEIDGLGCQTIVDALDPSVYAVEVLDPTDEFPKPWGTLKVRMARVRLRDGGTR